MLQVSAVYADAVVCCVVLRILLIRHCTSRLLRPNSMYGGRSVKKLPSLQERY